MKKAWILQGGWQGHEPALVARRFQSILQRHHYQAQVWDTLDVLADADALCELDLLVFCWTMGDINPQYVRNVCHAVGTGVGLAGCHGGLCDSFRQETEWQFMTGGQWVSHPGNDTVEYTVHIPATTNPLVAGLQDFTVRSEQYY